MFMCVCVVYARTRACVCVCRAFERGFHILYIRRGEEMKRCNLLSCTYEEVLKGSLCIVYVSCLNGNCSVSA